MFPRFLLTVLVRRYGVRLGAGRATLGVAPVPDLQVSRRHDAVRHKRERARGLARVARVSPSQTVEDTRLSSVVTIARVQP